MNEQKTNLENEKLIGIKTVNTYLWCAIIILTFFIIIQFTLAHCGNEELADQFTFASTISSIILSVIAIIMSVVSSDSINNLLHKFRDLHDEIKDTPARITSSVESISTVSQEFEKSKEIISETMSQLGNSVKQIYSATDEMKDVLSKIEESIHGIDYKFSKSFDELKETVVEEQSKYKNPHSTTGSDSLGNILPPAVITKYLEKSSILGVKLIYAAKLAQNQSKILDIIDLAKLYLGENNTQYLYGYLVASSSMGLFNINSISGDSKSIYQNIISNMNTQLLNEIENTIDKKVQDQLIESELKYKIQQFINESPDIPTQ